MNDGLAALTQLSDEGMDLSPGETVRYVVTDSRSKDPRKRVVVEQLVSGDEYDEEAYVDLLARASETLFLPFGYTRERMLSRVRE
jgi:DNA polymerase elongation subunit (family B)